MKYSLKDFRRAAGRHVDDMELSSEGRARLTKPIIKRRSPLMSAGWAAAAAACLIMIFLLNLPGQGTPRDLDSARPAISMTAQPADALSPSNSDEGNYSNAASEAENERISGNSERETSGAGAIDSADAMLDERVNLSNRSDARYVLYDRESRAYYLNEATLDEYFNIDYDTANFYTYDEVMATDAGRQYYGGNGDSTAQRSFSYTLWPRPECVTYLPEIPNGNWQMYYVELGMGTVLKNEYESGMACWALGDMNGLTIDYVYSNLFDFTVNGRAVAALPYDESDPTVQRWGAIDASGKWVVEPRIGQLSELYAEYEPAGSVTAYYVIRTYTKYEYLPENQSITADSGPVYVWDKDGNILLTAADIGMLYSSLSSPIPYRDIDSGLWGYFDKNIDIIIEPQFTTAYEFSQGLAAVIFPSDDKFGFIDETGSIAIAPQFWQVDRLGFVDGIIRAKYSYDDVWHDIDLHGNDVTGALKLNWRRLLAWRDSMPIDGRLGNIGLIFLTFLLIYAIYVSRNSTGYDAPKQRRRLGPEAICAFIMIYTALDISTHANLPGFMLADIGSYDSSTCAALVALIVPALISGFMYGWTERQICVRKGTLIAACAIMPLLPCGIRFALGASTVMDIDIALALFMGMIPGALCRAYEDDYAPHGFKQTALTPIVYVLISIALIGLWTYDWGGQATPVLEQARIERLDTDENRAYYNNLLESNDSALEWQFGEGWRETLKAALDSPDEYRVLRADFAIRNYSLRRTSSATAWCDTSELISDAGLTIVLGSAYVDISDGIAPFEQSQADFRIIVRADTNLQDLPDGITPQCSVYLSQQ